MANRKQVDFPFPIKGKHEGAAYRQQPEGTTPDALNVRAFDAIANRLRGGQRNGLSKYIAAAVNGTSAIQAISQLTTALDPTAVVASTAIFGPDTFTQGNAVLDQTHYYTKIGSNNTYLGAGNTSDLEDEAIPSQPVVLTNAVHNTGTNTAVAFPIASITPGNNYVIEADILPGGVNTVQFYFIFRGPVITAASHVSSAEYCRAYLVNAQVGTIGTTRMGIKLGATAAVETAMFDSLGYPLTYFSTVRRMKLTVSGDTMRLYLDGALMLTRTSTALNTQTSIGFGMSKDNNTNLSTFDNFTVSAATVPASLRTTKLLVTSGGSFYTGTNSAGLVLAIGGSAAQIAAGRTSIQQAYGKAYLCDGMAGDYKVYDPSTDQVTAWTALTGSLPGGNVTATLTGANTAASTFTVAAATGLAVGQLVAVNSTTTNSGLYRITVIAGTTITVTPAPLNNTDVGTMTASSGATMIALYRGRIVLAGLASDPQNWFMSKVGDPRDWNYTPTTTTQTMAVAGNNSTAGLMGDVITCLAPHNDDLMFMGGDHTLWVMRGDPAAGGMVDNISYQTGVAGPDAFTRDPEGNCYFFGAGTFWQMPAGSWVPQPLSRGVMDRTFGAIDYATFNVRLLWDENNKGVHLYFTPSSQPTTAPIHYFWDKRAGGFWPDTYPIVQGPTAVWNYDADLPTDRAMLLGGFDSYLRQIPAAIQKDDDGTTIHSYVRYAPQIIGGDLANSRLSELTPIMSKTSDPASIRVYAAGTPEAVAVATVPQVSHVLSAGRNSTMRQRVTGNAIAIELENVATAWATATYYAAGVQVLVGTTLYTCIAPHTSTTGGAHPTPSTPNTTDWTAGTTRSWAVESVVGVMDAAGKVRSGRL